MRINFGNVKLKKKINFGDVKLGVKKVYPELENLEIIPRGEEQNFKSSKYGYNNVKVRAVELQPNKVVSPTETTQIITADSEYSGLNQVEINPIPLRKDDLGGYDWIIEPSFEEDIKYLFNGEYIKQLIIQKVNDSNLKALVERTITTVNNNLIYNVGSYAFKNCTTLSEIDLSNVKTINSYAFDGCVGLKEINFPKLEIMSEYAFFNCSGIERVNLPNTTNIGQNSLSGLTSCKLIELDKCDFPAIPITYFTSTTGRIVLPSVKKIYNGTFKTSNFSEIVFPQNYIITLVHYGGFSNSSVSNGEGFIYVPDDLVEGYKSKTNWSTYADQIKPMSELPTEVA